jgi:hypothetical protein
MTLKLRFAAFLVVAMSWGSVARADFSYSESSAYNAIASMLLTNTSNTSDQGECAATSLMNSFQYLQNIAPGTYGTNLTQGSGTAAAASARDTLDMSITGSRLQGDVWNAKLNWFTNNGGTNGTTFEGITQQSSTSSQGAGYTVGRGNMTFGASGTDIWNFLTDQINKGQDVEIGMFDHMVTLMGLKLSGTNMYAQIIDPNYPTPGGTGAGGMSNSAAGEWVNASYDSTGLVRLSGFSIGGTGYNNPLIYYAFAESPVSVAEPAAIALLGMTPVGGLLIYRWRRRKRTS